MGPILGYPYLGKLPYDVCRKFINSSFPGLWSCGLWSVSRDLPLIYERFVERLLQFLESFEQFIESQRISRRFTKGCRRFMQDDDQADP